MENKLSTTYSSYLDTNKSTLTHVCTHTHTLYPYFWQRNPIVFLNLCVSECVCRFGACPPHLIAIRCKVNLFHFLPFDMVLELCHRPFIKNSFLFANSFFQCPPFFNDSLSLLPALFDIPTCTHNTFMSFVFVHIQSITIQICMRDKKKTITTTTTKCDCYKWGETVKNLWPSSVFFY